MISAEDVIRSMKRRGMRSILRLGSVPGFTLLEVLVALSVMGIAVVVLFQIFSADLRAIGVSADYAAAAVRAEVRMREVLDTYKLTENAWNEVTADGYRYDIVITEILNQRTELLPVRLLSVALTIYWKKGEKDKSMILRTVKMVSRQP